MKEQGKQDEDSEDKPCVGGAVTGAAAAEEGGDGRRKGRQRAKTLSAHTVLAFSDGYDLSGRASMRLGPWGDNKTATSERNGASKTH
jgi:hypothetical protein